MVLNSFSGGRSRSTRREPPTMGKQLANFITCDCVSSAPFFVYLEHQFKIDLRLSTKLTVEVSLKNVKNQKLDSEIRQYQIGHSRKTSIKRHIKKTNSLLLFIGTKIQETSFLTTLKTIFLFG
jgi:hypothetical protein